MRSILVTLMFSLAVLFIACGPKAATDSAAKETPTEEAPAVKETPPTEANSNAAYTTTVLKENLPSPRKEMKGSIGGANVTINYGSPSVKGRTIWGGLVPYGKVWRTGANEATTIEVSADVMVEGQKLPAGKYGLFTESTEDGTDVIFNSVHEQWGAYDYDKSKDVVRVNVSRTAASESSETMEFMIDGDAIVLVWESQKIPFKVAAG